MAERLHTDEGREHMRQRRISVEPLFGQIKQRLGGTGRFSRRGLNAARDEWKLICATSNLLKALASHHGLTTALHAETAGKESESILPS